MKLLPKISLALSCVAAVTCTINAQTPTWTAELISTQPPSWSFPVPRAVNDAGQITGVTTVDLIKRAWIGSPGLGLQLLPMPAGGTYAEAHDINAAGVVAGFALIGGASRAVIWQQGPSGYEAVLLPAGSDGTFPFDARAINDRGDVVGKYGLFGTYVWNAVDDTTSLSSFPVLPAEINNQRQIIGDTFRMDVDTLVVEDLGDPVGTGFNYIFTKLTEINDAGQCGGYANVASGMSQNKQAVRYSDGPVWKAFNSQPLNSANVMGIAASGDTAIQLGIHGSFIHVEGLGSIPLANILDSSSSNFDLGGSFAPLISRGARIACTGADTSTGQIGILLLTPAGFDDLGGASTGALGTPVLGGYGALTPGAATRLRLASAAPNSIAFLAGSNTATPVPAFGGLFHPGPGIDLVILPTDSLGRIDLTVPWPSVGVGTAVFIQAGVVDPEASAGVALSNALAGVTK